MSEHNFVNNLYAVVSEGIKKSKYGWLRKIYKNKNLSTKEFQQIWSEWWRGTALPRTEVDLILIFEDPTKFLDSVVIGGVEVKYFATKDITRRNFYEGIQQALALSIFGFDGLSLWHIFSSEIEDEVIENNSSVTNDLIRGFKLPVYYLSAKVLDEKEMKLKSFEPFSIERDLEYFMSSLGSYWMKKESRNPLLQNQKVTNRRKVLKTLLKIPV